MHADWEECPFAQHPLESGVEFDLGDREAMSKMKRAVHVWIGECPEPLRELVVFCGWWRVDFEDMIIPPPVLVFLLPCYQEVALICLQSESGVSFHVRRANRAPESP